MRPDVRKESKSAHDIRCILWRFNHSGKSMAEEIVVAGGVKEREVGIECREAGIIRKGGVGVDGIFVDVIEAATVDAEGK